jgi:AcrR family transcriptional regulator
VSEATETEIKILEAAKKVFEMYGYAGARMQQIADMATISKASLHYYFRSKEKLFDHIFEDTMSEFFQLILTWENDDEDWETKLRTFIQQFFRFLKTKSMLFIIHELNSNPDLMTKHQKQRKHMKNRLIAYFEKQQVAGKIKHDINVVHIYMFVHSLCAYPIMNRAIFKMTTHMQDKEFDRFMDAYPAFVADFLIQGIKNNSIDHV